MTGDAESIDFKPIGAEQMTRPLGVHWIHGSESAKHNTDPDIQVHWYDEHTVILRQNMAINYEARWATADVGAVGHRCLPLSGRDC